MKWAWAGIALLSASWLAGLGYYHAPDWPVWIALVALGTVLLMGAAPRMPSRTDALLALVLLLPVVWLAPWPYRGAPLLIVLGLAIQLPPIPRRWPGRIGPAAVAAGVVLAAQWPAMTAYASLTARSHELPYPLPQLLGGIAQFLGIDAAGTGSTLTLHSMRLVHPLAACWELLLDPPSLCFLVGGVVLLVWKTWAETTQGGRLARTAKAVAAFGCCVAAWLPVRAGLLMAIYLHRVLRTDYDAPLHMMDQFWSTGLHLLLLIGPVLLARRFVRVPVTQEARAWSWLPMTPRYAAAVCLVFAAIGVLCLAMVWDPVGRRKDGRVLVDEYHSKWEPTDKPFDTTYYGHLSGYNYACIYDYASRFYDMRRLTTGITDAVLRDCDVLILKVPTIRFSAEEVDTVRRFVERGGGLLLIGEHTDVFGTGTYLNDIARTFGFCFRFDCLFDIDGGFEQKYRPAVVPHPIAQHLPSLDFAVSCSISPGMSSGRAAIRSTGLKNLPADYHASNFYPQMEDRPDMRYGSFVQLWTTRQGAGRVVAFTDSTQFSNFCVFEPGKSELLLGMIEWANHRGGPDDPRRWLVPLGLVLLIGGLILARPRPGAWLPLLAAGMLGWAAAGASARAMHRTAMPAPKPARSVVRVAIDRTVCDAPLSKGGFIAGKPEGFGIFERWILRLGYFTVRTRGAEALTADLVVLLHPHLPVTDEFRDAVVRYVDEGGKVLVVDSPQNQDTTANSLLYPFQLAVNRASIEGGELTVPEGWASVSVESACEITGGHPLIRLNGKPVAASVRYGKGSVLALGFGSRFTDVSMGVTGDIVPGPDLQTVYDLQFALLRMLAEDKAATRPSTTQAAP